MQINENWKIESDGDLNIILMQRKVSEPSEKFPNGNESWRQTYHPSVAKAFESLINKEVNLTELEDLETVRDCIQDLYRLFSTIPVITLEKIVSKVKEVEADE